MIQPQTYPEVADNTGARKIMCIRVLKGSNAKYATVGDVIVASVKEAIPRGGQGRGRGQGRGGAHQEGDQAPRRLRHPL